MKQRHNNVTDRTVSTTSSTASNSGQISSTTSTNNNNNNNSSSNNNNTVVTSTNGKILDCQGYNPNLPSGGTQGKKRFLVMS